MSPVMSAMYKCFSSSLDWVFIRHNWSVFHLLAAYQLIAALLDQREAQYSLNCRLGGLILACNLSEESFLSVTATSVTMLLM